MRPELLAVRAVNQYRRRDILAYVGLRYYLENSCALSDRWIREVSIHLVNTSVNPTYYRSYHFKEIDNDGSVRHRDIYIPGPNEILAETCLLNRCADEPAFTNLPCVYSYQFPKSNSKEGIFRNYFPGFRERHRSVSKVCSESDDYIVRYTDIRKFYPSISNELATKVWESACNKSGISQLYEDLGNHLLSNHARVAERNDEKGILTGPMFSHLIANLVLSEVDNIMLQEMGGKYWRYVDDIMLVGSADQVDDGRKLLQSLLVDMGFELHNGDKDFDVQSTEWLQGANDFDNVSSTPWISLIANIKRFLVANPDKRGKLIHIFSEYGINIPLLDYSNTVDEAVSLEKLLDWLGKYWWAPKAVRSLTIDELLRDALRTREFYKKRFIELVDGNSDAKGYSRRRLIPKLRYYAGRLCYLATPEMLTNILSYLTDFPELRLRMVILATIRSRDVTEILGFGTNATQAAAQILRMSSEVVTCSLNSFNDVELQGLAILRMNGVNIDTPSQLIDEANSDLLNQFVLGINPLQMMKSDDPFIKEIACLRGIDNLFRHQSMFDTAFDRDEDLSFDVINQLHDSNYY